MQVTAEQKFIRMSPQKIRLVVASVKNLPPQEALTNLKFLPNKASDHVAKVINQALANAKENFKLNPSQMQISEILVNEGPTLKRWRAVSRGRAHSILKRSSHIRVILKSKPVKSVSPVQAKAEKKETAPVKEASKQTKPVAKKTASKKTTTKTTTKATQTTKKVSKNKK